MNNIVVVQFELEKPVNVHFVALRINDSTHGIMFNVRRGKKVYHGKTIGAVIGKMFNDVDWSNVLGQN